MLTLVESISAAILLILMVLLITHLMNKDAAAWLASKFQVAE
jgi:hypothetical protein